jgi:FkbM family methyltransferase
MSAKDEILKIIRSIVNPIGYDIVKYKSTHPAHVILKHMTVNNINTLLDVGANAGQYSIALRKAGFNGRIISFEPLSDAFSELKITSSRDENWQSYNYALGDANTLSTINVSGHSPSSSFLPMTDTLREVAPGSGYIREEQIEIKTLDSVFSSLGLDDESVFLKIDTQGYEKKVLDGAIGSLDKIKGIQLELSATKLYEGEQNYYSICSFLESLNFRLVRVIPGFSDKVSGEMLQFDAIFFRKLN